MTDSRDRGTGPDSRDEDIVGPAVIVYTTEDDSQGPVRQAAQAHAREHGCVLVLYAADAAGFLSEPLPNALDGEGAGDRFRDRLGLADLEYLGRSAVARQVLASREAGARACAWLPKDHGTAALAHYASAQDAHIVFVPEQLAVYDELSALLSGVKSSTDLKQSGIEIRVVGATASR